MDDGVAGGEGRKPGSGDRRAGRERRRRREAGCIYGAPEEAALMAEKSGCDVLAVAIGNATTKASRN
jgi:fructose/tagatose bisphosphate aldolase